MTEMDERPLPKIVKRSWQDIIFEVGRLAARWEDHSLSGVFGIPSGGAPVACLLAIQLEVPILDRPKDGCLVVDDLVDSGATAARYEGHQFDALYRKPDSPNHLAPEAIQIDGWISFPWENDSTGPEDAVVRLLQWIGENPTRPGLINTPARVTRSWRELTSGYGQDAGELLSVTFPDTSDQMVVLDRIEFTSLCEHHILPFTGTATVGYLPRGEVVGLSKLARTVDVFSKRLQIQERLTGQIADAMVEHLAPLGVGVVIKAHHSCMSLRGVGKRDALMVTSALRGVFLEDPATRAEFLRLSDSNG